MNCNMQLIYSQITALVEQCLAALNAIQPKGGHFLNPSPETCAEYHSLAKSLLKRAGDEEHGLTQVVQDTSRPSTFFKRLAALRYYCYIQMDLLMAQLQQTTEESAWRELQFLLTEHLHQMQTLAEIQQQGFNNPRRKRNSKRQALAGLPPDWREMLCNRGKHGKYAMALLASAITGCRPSELKRGIKIWRKRDVLQGKTLIYFQIQGCKVKNNQGQPSRLIVYDAEDVHPLITVMNSQFQAEADTVLEVQVTDPVNFTVEIRRLANCLWPHHKYPVTAYCFRHQWSADNKILGDGDAVSRGLGHVSAKTRRNYGTANQSNEFYRLRPVRIEADLPIKTMNIQYSAKALDNTLP